MRVKCRSMIHFPTALLQIAFEMDILELYNLLPNSTEGHNTKYDSIKSVYIAF